MSSSAQLDLSDSSSSDDSDLDELLQDNDCEITILLLAVKELEDRARLLNRRRGSIMSRNYIYRNRALGHVTLVDDYFVEFSQVQEVLEMLSGGWTKGLPCGVAGQGKPLFSTDSHSQVTSSLL